MASQYADPPAPYTEVVSTSTTNNKARLNAYTDTKITLRNVAPAVPVPEPEPPRSGSRTLGNIRPVYAEDNRQEIENKDAHPEAVEPKHAPNSWPIITDAQGITRGRDMYRNHGVLGQDDFVQNQGGA